MKNELADNYWKTVLVVAVSLFAALKLEPLFPGWKFWAGIAGMVLILGVIKRWVK